MSTTTDLTTLKINYLTEAQYETALNNDEINDDEIYVTPTTDMTSAEVTAFIASLSVRSSCPYMVGDIYITTNTASPETIWPDTEWDRIEDTFLLAAGSTYSAGATGGEATHKLIESELPSITGSFNIRANSAGGNLVTAVSGKFSREDGSSTASVTNNSSSKAVSKVTYAFGGGGSHNNMPPYLAVNVWVRTA